MALIKQTALGLAAGLIGWAIVWFLWRPFLNSSGHLISFGLSSAKNRALIKGDYEFVRAVLLAQAVMSGASIGRPRKVLLALTVSEFFIPWTLYYLWVLVVAPQGDDYNLVEMLSWMSLTIVMNLTIFGLQALIQRVQWRGKVSGAS